VAVPPPQLQISPQQLYFPLAVVNSWVKASCLISNLGYREVFVALRKPANISFDLEAELEGGSNRLTKLSNTLEVTLFFRSKNPVSFSVVLVVESNFGDKYEVKLNGTASRSPLLNCERAVESSASLSNR
jgi:hypothetical protein